MPSRTYNLDNTCGEKLKLKTPTLSATFTCELPSHHLGLHRARTEANSVATEANWLSVEVEGEGKMIRLARFTLREIYKKVRLQHV
jgi:hypothetical protein